jgi:hypothetical protein
MNEKRLNKKQKTQIFDISKQILFRLKNVQNLKLYQRLNFKIFKKNYVSKDMNMKQKLQH